MRQVIGFLRFATVGNMFADSVFVQIGALIKVTAIHKPDFWGGIAFDSPEGIGTVPE